MIGGNDNAACAHGLDPGACGECRMEAAIGASWPWGAGMAAAAYAYGCLSEDRKIKYWQVLLSVADRVTLQQDGTVGIHVGRNTYA